MTTFPNAAVSCDAGLDDNLVGIVNNSGATITTITLSSATDDIFGFDGDGVCSTTSGNQTTTSPGYTFVAVETRASNSTDPSDYGGPYTLAVATNINERAGTVTFGNGGIPNGGYLVVLTGRTSRCKPDGHPRLNHTRASLYGSDRQRT